MMVEESSTAAFTTQTFLCETDTARSATTASLDRAR